MDIDVDGNADICREHNVMGHNLRLCFIKKVN